MGEKDYQQYFLVKDFIIKKIYKVKIIGCKTLREKNGCFIISEICYY